jgi:ABC-type multidrug transport system fused ATPase/permease subunit
MKVLNFKESYKLLNSDERYSLIFIFLILFVSVVLDTFSFAIIVPVFDVIFLDKLPNYNLGETFQSFFFFIFNNKITLLIFVLVIFFIKNFFLIYCSYIVNKFFNNHEIRCRNNLFKFFLNQEYSLFLKKNSKNFITKIIDDVTRYKTYLSFLIIFCVEVLFIIFLIILLSYYNFYILIFCFFSFSSIFFIYIKLVKKKLYNWSVVRQTNLSSMQKILIEGYEGIKDIIIYNLKSLFFNKLYNYNKLASDSGFKSDFVNSISRLWIEILVVFAVIIPMIFLVSYGKSLNVYLSIFTIYTLAIFRLVPSINRLVTAYQQLTYSNTGFLSVLEQFQKNKLILKNDSYIDFKECIEFKNVTYEFADQSKILFQNVNLKIIKNQCIGIFGSNGSGKSTFLNLLSGIVNPSSGEVIVDYKYKIFNNLNWFSRISFVHQDIFLLNDTIKNNICLESDKNNIDEVKFNHILNSLKIYNFFNSLEFNLDTPIDSNGVKLSGGQKQLISIARAMYKTYDLIIFDEANSALDVNFKEILKKIIVNLKKTSTIVMVTHDTSFLQFCDKSYEIVEGKFYNK